MSDGLIITTTKFWEDVRSRFEGNDLVILAHSQFELIPIAVPDVQCQPWDLVDPICVKLTFSPGL
jgi:hypothetical protein